MRFPAYIDSIALVLQVLLENILGEKRFSAGQNKGLFLWETEKICTCFWRFNLQPIL